MPVATPFPAPLLVNCTSHAVRILLASGRAVELPPTDDPARVTAPPGERGTLLVEGEPVEVVRGPANGPCVGLPPARAGVYLVVSRAVATACQDRPDLLAPGTAPVDGPLRDEQGHIVAVRCLRRFTARP